MDRAPVAMRGIQSAARNGAHSYLSTVHCAFERPLSIMRLFGIAFSRMGLGPCPLHEALKRMIRTSNLFRSRAANSRTLIGNGVANGFTLMELLIVMAIIAILSLLAMASVVTYIKRANGISAVNSVQKIVQAEMLFSSSYPAIGYACTLQALGGEPASGPPSAQAAQLLPSDLAAGFKSGYAFTIACTDKVTVNGVDRSNGFTVSAVPQTVGKTGDRSYCSDESGQVKFDPAGGTNCVQSLQ